MHAPEREFGVDRLAHERIEGQRRVADRLDLFARELGQHVVIGDVDAELIAAAPATRVTAHAARQARARRVAVRYPDVHKRAVRVPDPCTPRLRWTGSPRRASAKRCSGPEAKSASSASRSPASAAGEELDEVYGNWRDRIALPRRHATRGHVVAELLQHEREQLRASPPVAFDAAGRRASRVPLDGYLKLAGSFYRAPEALVHQRVELRWDRDRVWIDHHGQRSRISSALAPGRMTRYVAGSEPSKISSSLIGISSKFSGMRAITRIVHATVEPAPRPAQEGARNLAAVVRCASLPLCPWTQRSPADEQLERRRQVAQSHRQGAEGGRSTRANLRAPSI